MSEHGTRSRYNSGCRCDMCRKANREYEKARVRRNARIEWGEQSGWVDADLARREVERLRKRGYTLKEICRLTGIHRSSMYALTTAHNRTGRPVKRCKRETFEALQNVKGHSVRSGTLLDARELADRMRAYRASGLKAIDLARATGIDRQVVDALLKGRRKRVTGRTMHAFIKAKPLLDRLSAAKKGETWQIR